MGTELVKSVSIDNLLNQRDGVAALLEKGFAALREAARLAQLGGMGFPGVTLGLGQCGSVDVCAGYTDEKMQTVHDKCMKLVDAGAWRYLMEESGLKTFMDAKARNEWSRKVYACDVPVLTFGNIEATFAQMHAERGMTFERGVIGVFESLSWDYKTNTPFRFGKRLIMNRMVSYYGKGLGRSVSVCSNSTNGLDDLERVFHILDKKPEPDSRASWSRLLDAPENRRAMMAESDYFSVKWFMKGTGHVLFKRPDLVDQMNLILARHYPDALAYERH